MSKKSKMRKVIVTMELDVSDRYKTLKKVEERIRYGFEWIALSSSGITITKLATTCKGLYHLVPDDPEEE